MALQDEAEAGEYHHPQNLEAPSSTSKEDCLEQVLNCSATRRSYAVEASVEAACSWRDEHQGHDQQALCSPDPKSSPAWLCCDPEHHYTEVEQRRVNLGESKRLDD